jgi:hypothetical protein
MGNGVAVILILVLCISGVLCVPFESKAEFPSTVWLGDWVSHKTTWTLWRKEVLFALKIEPRYPGYLVRDLILVLIITTIKYSSKWWHLYVYWMISDEVICQ